MRWGNAVPKAVGEEGEQTGGVLNDDDCHVGPTRAQSFVSCLQRGQVEHSPQDQPAGDEDEAQVTPNYNESKDRP